MMEIFINFAQNKIICAKVIKHRKKYGKENARQIY